MKKLFKNQPFGFHLKWIFDMLPGAAAAFSEMPALRRNAPVARRQDFENSGANIVLFFRAYSRKNFVSGNGIGYENRLAVIAPG